MKRQTIKIKASVGRNVSLSANYENPTDCVEDAKKICAFLLGVVPSGTFDEVERFFQKFQGTIYPISDSPTFNAYWEKKKKA